MSSKTPYKVLCVCLGNICRSPTAEVVLRHFCDEKQLNVIVDSAGTSNYHPNKAPDSRSQKHAIKRGYDLSSLRARQLKTQDFLEFDLILAMDAQNLADLQVIKDGISDTDSKLAKLALFSEEDPTYGGDDVPDPYQGDGDAFEEVIERIESSAQAWIESWKTAQ